MSDLEFRAIENKNNNLKVILALLITGLLLTQTISFELYFFIILMTAFMAQKPNQAPVVK